MTSDPQPGLARIRQAYNVPAFLGWQVNVNGRIGRIVGHDQAILLLQDETLGGYFTAHPTWKTAYRGPLGEAEDAREGRPFPEVTPAREATPEGLQRLLDDVLSLDDPAWAVEVPQGRVTGVFPEGRVSMESILTKRAARCSAEGKHYVGGLHIAGACRACGTRT